MDQAFDWHVRNVPFFAPHALLIFAALTLHVFLIIILPPLRATPLKKSTGHRRQTLKIIVEICTDISVISFTLQLWSTLVKCLSLKVQRWHWMGLIQKLWDCLLYIDDDMERRRKEINCVCMQACEVCNERPPICFGTWYAPRVTKISLFTLISKQ